LAAKTGSFTSTQLYQLKSQVLCYRQLIRNIPPSLGLMTASATANPNLWASERDRLTQKAGTAAVTQ
jgi:hypothetical protein